MHRRAAEESDAGAHVYAPLDASAFDDSVADRGMGSWETAIQHKSIIFGSPDRVRGEMQRVATESGCNYVICSFAWGTLSRE
jgi:hypothetical protein